MSSITQYSIKIARQTPKQFGSNYILSVLVLQVRRLSFFSRIDAAFPYIKAVLWLTEYLIL